MTPTLVVILLAGMLWPAGAAAQDPPVDSTAVAPDSVTLGRPDSLRARPDSLAAADSFPVFHNLPELPDRTPEGWDGAVWGWDHEQLMASGAHTLVELLDDVPGVIPLIAGDYGTPAAFSALGHAAGGVRVLRDGFELMPLSGGVVDLQRVGLGGIERVRLRRDGGRIVVEMWSLDFDDPRPYSLVEAGTGDLDNNLFRGAFTAPNALGGSVALALERSDTRGAGARETGSRTGSWVRYQVHRGDDAGIALDFRRMGSRSEVADYPAPVTRTDLTVRARARLTDGIVAELQAGRSSLDVEDERRLYALDGGRRNQFAATVAANRGGTWANGAFRLFEGDDLLENRLDLEGGWRFPEVGELSARLTREDWKGARPISWGVNGWARPVPWMTVFGSWADGEYGAR